MAAASKLVRHGCLASLLLLSVCGTPLSERVRYTGKVSPETIDGGAGCAEASSATLIASRSHFAFTPTDGVVTLSGEVAPDGSLDATTTLAGADRKPYLLRFAGHMTTDAVTGHYVTPRCGFIVELHRNRSRQFEVPYL